MVESAKARKQRKAMYNAPIHVRRKMVASHLSEALAKEYGLRSALVIKGDTVRIMRGDEETKGTEGKVAKINTKTGRVTIEGVTIPKADGTQVPRPIHASKLMITKLEMSDPKRKGRLQQGKEASK